MTDFARQFRNFVRRTRAAAARLLPRGQALAREQKRAAELDALRRLSLELAAVQNTQSLLQSLVESVVHLLAAQGAAVFLANEQQTELVCALSFHLPGISAGDRIEWGKGLAGRVALRGEALSIPNYSEWSGRAEALTDVPLHTLLGIPLKWQNQVLGVIDIHREQSHPPFDQDELRLAELFGAQAAVALQNVRLLDARQVQLDAQRTLTRVTRTFLSTLDSQRIINQAAASATELVGADAGMVLLPTPGGELVIRGVFGWPQIELLGRIVSDQVMIPAIGLQNPQTVIWNDLERNSPATLHPLARQAGFLSGAAVPMISGDTARGVLTVNARQAREFTSSDIENLSLLASQTAIALERANYFERVERGAHETQTLFEFAQQLGSTLDVDELGRRALDAVRRLMPFDIGEVSLVQEPSGLITPVTLYGTGLSRAARDAQIRQVLHAPPLPRGKGIIGWSVEHGQVVRTGDVQSDARYVPLSQRVRSEICVPLRVGERIIGVLNLESETPDAFDLHAEQLLLTLANPLALAIENARLYEQTKRDAEVKTALLRELSHRVKNNLAAITSLLYLALDEPAEGRSRILNETVGRVQSMALAHSLLAHSEQARADLRELGRQVLNDAVHHLAQPSAAVRVTVEGVQVQVAARQTTTLALVLNELATNALRHGLMTASEKAEPTLRLEVSCSERQVTLKLLDNGGGLPPDFDLRSNTGLGLNLVRTLVEKDLRGYFQIRREDGWTMAEIQFAYED